MIVVSDTSPITNLAAIGQLDLLQGLYTNHYSSSRLQRDGKCRKTRSWCDGGANLTLDSNSGSCGSTTSHRNSGK